MNATYALHQEDRVFLEHVERALLAVLERSTNTFTQTEALTALLCGLWNLPRVTHGLSCAVEYSPNEVGMRFEISAEAVSFSYGSGFHASFWLAEEGSHVGSRWGECGDKHSDYHSWKVLLEMFENDLSCPDTGFTVELISRPSLTTGILWNRLPKLAHKGVKGLTELES